VNGGAGFGVDGEKRLRLPGADAIRIKSEWHGIDPSVGAQVEEFLAVLAPAYALRSDGRVYAVPLAFDADSVRAGQPEPLFTIDAEARAAIHSVVSFDVSADGSRFVIPSMTPGESSALV